MSRLIGSSSERVVASRRAVLETLRRTAKSLSLVAVAAALAALGVGCLCTANLVESVDIFVVDGTGATVKEATVTYSLDEAPEQPADCYRPDYHPPGSTGNVSVSASSSTGGGIEGCLEWSAGGEQTGTFVVHVVAADGRKGEGEVHVGKNIGGCHVNTQTLTITVK